MNRIKNFFSKPSKIELSITQDAFNTEKSLEQSTNKLKSLFVSKEQSLDKDYDSVWSGFLDWRIKKINRLEK